MENDVFQQSVSIKRYSYSLKPYDWQKNRQNINGYECAKKLLHLVKFMLTVYIHYSADNNITRGFSCMEKKNLNMHVFFSPLNDEMALNTLLLHKIFTRAKKGRFQITKLLY